MPPNTNIEVDRRIMSEIYTSSEPMDNLKILCDVYGSRFPGTPDDFKSVKWMVDKLKGYGIDNAHYETFEFQGWVRGQAKLEVTSPIQKEIRCISLPGGLAGEVESKLVFLGDGPLDVYEKRKDEIRDNVVLMTSRQPQGMTRRLARSEKYMRSVLAGARGWIFMNHYPAYGPATGYVNPVIPSVSVSYEDGHFLTRLLERGDNVKIRITTTDRSMEMTSYNVISDIFGYSSEKQHVLLGCHYDGHDISQGAIDPVSGTVTILEIARVLNMVKEKLKHRIRFVCFGCEEIGLLGSHNYVIKHRDELQSLRFMFNLDAAGKSGRKGVILHCRPELETLITKAAEEMKVELPLLQQINPYSDHWPFFVEGVPTAKGDDPSIFSNWTGRGYGHTCYDTVDKVELEYLRLAAATYSRLAFRIANTDSWTARRKTKEEIAQIIRQQGYHQTVALVEKVKKYVKTRKEIHPATDVWLRTKSYW